MTPSVKKTRNSSSRSFSRSIHIDRVVNAAPLSAPSPSVTLQKYPDTGEASVRAKGNRRAAARAYIAIADASGRSVPASVRQIAEGSA